MSPGSQAVQLCQGRTKGNRASGDLTDVQGRVKGIAGSRLHRRQGLEHGGGLYRIPRKREAKEHLSMEGAPDRESCAL